ncbi:MAG: hypothetical protein ACKOBV_09285 [Candidatus Kapaibacterium sp.]
MRRTTDITNTKSTVAVLLVSLLVLAVGCDNPFAPRKAERTQTSAGLGDQSTVDGVFQNFRYAYLTKDTLVYGRLLDTNFTFIFRDYDTGIDKSWGRDQDMIATAGLFRSSESLDLIWNNVVSSVGDSLVRDISRGFNLTITFSASDVVFLQGRVNLRISRPRSSEVWMIQRWRDESNF